MKSINHSILKGINMLKVDDRAKQLRVNHVINIAHNHTPQYLRQTFILVSSNHQNGTRGSFYNFKISGISSCESESFYHNVILD